MVIQRPFLKKSQTLYKLCTDFQDELTSYTMPLKIIFLPRTAKTIKEFIPEVGIVHKCSGALIADPYITVKSNMAASVVQPPNQASRKRRILS